MHSSRALQLKHAFLLQRAVENEKELAATVQKIAETEAMLGALAARTAAAEADVRESIDVQPRVTTALPTPS